LKREFLELLDRDLEFRYAVAGYLGLSEILKRLDMLAEEQVKLREEQIRLREEQTKIWTEIKRLSEGQTKIWEEIANLRREQIRLTEEQTRIWEEIKLLREGQTKIWEEIMKVWGEIRALREGQIRLERRIGSLEDSFSSLRSAMIGGFGELSRFAGLTFEEFVRKFLSEYMRRSGEIPSGVELVRSIIDGEEINLFLEEPLIVGEATGYAESAEEVRKLLRKADIVRARYSREPRKILVLLSVRRDAVEDIRRVAGEVGVEPIIGRVVD